MKETKFPLPTAVKDGDEGGAGDINGGGVVKLYSDNTHPLAHTCKLKC